MNTKLYKIHNFNPLLLLSLLLLRYNKLCGMIESVASKLKELNPKDPFRNEGTTQLLEKL